MNAASSSIVKAILRRLLANRGYEVLQGDLLYDWQINPPRWAAVSPSALPLGSAEILSADNPLLKSLEQRYSRFDKRATAPLLWKANYISGEEMRYFRSDNGYVWQLRGENMNPLGYALTTYYVLALDKLGLIERLHEDRAFGSFTLEIAGKTISRDLLDSIIELYFLNKHLNITSRERVRIVDIGAGYGRLAYRAVTAFPNIEYFCTDAVAVSTFVSQFYLEFRQAGDRAKAVPLDEIENTIGVSFVDLAVNIHSFSECRLEAIEWWVKLLSKARVKHLMIVPNSADGALRTNDGKDYMPIVQCYGYRLLAKDPKYCDGLVQRYGINPTYHFLFELI